MRGNCECAQVATFPMQTNMVQTIPPPKPHTVQIPIPVLLQGRYVFVLSPPTAHVIASARAPSHIAPALTRAAASGPTPAAAPSPPPPTLLLLLLLLLLLVLPLPLLLLLLLSVIIMVTTMTVVHRMLARRHRRRRPALLFLWRLLLVAAHGRVRHRRRVVPGRVVGRLGTHPGLVVVPVLDV